MTELENVQLAEQLVNTLTVNIGVDTPLTGIVLNPGNVREYCYVTCPDGYGYTRHEFEDVEGGRFTLTSSNGISIFNSSEEAIYEAHVRIEYCYNLYQWFEFEIISGNPSIIPDLKLPNSLTVIESQAFNSVAGKVVWVPASVKRIADDAFSKTVTLLVPSGSYAEKWAKEHQCHLEIGTHFSM